MKDAYYFPHDSNAHNDPKILGLRLKCGWEGVGLFWALIEILRDTPQYKYTSDLAILELGLSTAQATLQATLEACFELGLFVKKEGFFSSPALDRRMSDIDRRRDVLRDAGRRGGIKSSQAKARLKPPSSSKVKESKEKESKGIYAFDEIWKNYPNKDGRKAALKSFRASVETESDWKDIQQALKNYLSSEKVSKGFIKNGSTWFANWRDWIVPPFEKKEESWQNKMIDEIKSKESKIKQDVLNP